MPSPSLRTQRRSKINPSPTLCAIPANDFALTLDKCRAESALGAQNDLSSQLGALISQWAGILDTYNRQIFSGTSDSLQYLQSLMADGKLMGTDTSTDSYDISTTLQKTIYGILVPQAWKESNYGYRPFIM
jgi:hypothetical protein